MYLILRSGVMCLVTEAEPVQGEDDEEDEEESQSAITEIRFIPADKSMCK